MKHRMFFIRPVGLTMLVALLTAGILGCSTTKLVNVWKNPEFSKTPLTNVYVVAIKKDRANRRLWEDMFVKELQEYGVTATQSYKDYPDAPPDSNQLMSTMTNSQYDGLITTIGLPTHTHIVYEPGYVYDVPRFGFGDDDWDRWDDWYGTYGYYYGWLYGPGYYDFETVVRDRTDVWSTKGVSKLIWTGTSKVYDPTSGEQVRRDIIDKIMPELARLDVIPEKTKMNAY